MKDFITSFSMSSLFFFLLHVFFLSSTLKIMFLSQILKRFPSLTAAAAFMKGTVANICICLNSNRRVNNVSVSYFTSIISPSLILEILLTYTLDILPVLLFPARLTLHYIFDSFSSLFHLLTHLKFYDHSDNSAGGIFIYLAIISTTCSYLDVIIPQLYSVLFLTYFDLFVFVL